MGAPFYYNEINAETSQYRPNCIKPYNNEAFCFWLRSFYQRAISTLKVNNLPEEWEGEITDVLYFWLFKYGFVPVFKYKGTEIAFNKATLKGFDFYYQPTEAIVTNPVFKDGSANSHIFTIHKDCELLRLTPDYRGVFDILVYYAEKMALLDNAINVSLINSKVSYVLGAKNKGAAAAIKKALDKLNRGEPAVVYDMRIEDDKSTKTTPFQVFERGNMLQNYLTSSQLMDFQTILNQFDAEIGIQTIPYQKAERFVVAEADSKQEDSTARVKVWLDCLKRSAEKVNAMFGTNIDVVLRREEEDKNDIDALRNRELFEQSNTE